MKIAVLGPTGTYSTEAANNYNSAAEPALCSTISEVVDLVRNSGAAQGIIPLENSIDGIVAESLDSLARSGLLIEKEIVLPIRHVLCSAKEPARPDAIKRIYSHPQALNQCRDYLKSKYPGAELIISSSTAAAIKSLADEQNKNALAIGSEFAAKQYGMPVIDRSIEDEQENQTRFVVFSEKPEGKTLPFALIAAVPQSDRPGLLHDILSIIKNQEINMLQIDSRPSRHKLGSYIFYIRLEIVSDDPGFDNIVTEAKKIGVSIERMTV